MTPENSKRVNDIETLLSKLDQDVQRFKRNQEELLKSNRPIAPGAYPKIAYDKKGLVIHGTKLDVDDIPDLPVKKITGLNKILDRIPEEERLDDLIEVLGTKISKNENIKAGIGIKVRYDENGLIVESFDLTSSDLPLLPIDQIDGLSERLSVLEEIGRIIDPLDEVKINPGTHTKITYDSNGKVVRGDSISTTDLPAEILDRLSSVEGHIGSMVSTKVFDSIIQDINRMVVGNSEIKSGTFTKVTVDSKGLVTFGDKMELNDLPPITIPDILDLEVTLLKKANHSDLVELQNQVSVLHSNTQVMDLRAIQNQLAQKIDKHDVTGITAQLAQLQGEVERLNGRLPHEMLNIQIQQILSELSTLSGRISVIERRLGNQEEA